MCSTYYNIDQPEENPSEAGRQKWFNGPYFKRLHEVKCRGCLLSKLSIAEDGFKHRRRNQRRNNDNKHKRRKVFLLK